MEGLSVRQQLVWVCHQLYSKNLVHATAGNISALDETGKILITPSGFCLGEVSSPTVVSLSHNGTPDPTNGLIPSSEWRIHQAIYNARPDIQAVVHAHPPKGTTLAIAGKDLTAPYLAEAVQMIGPVPLVEFVLPGSEALAQRLYEGFKTSNGLILKNHGVFTVGSTLREAYYRMELIEALAEMVIHAHTLGPLNVLSADAVAQISHFDV